jgi:hypothetical protein
MPNDCLFVDNSDTVEVKVYYRSKNKRCQALTEDEFEKIKNKNQKERDEAAFKEEAFSKIVLNMKQLSWGLYNELQESSTESVEGGERVFNYRLYRERKFEKLLVAWDAKDASGNAAQVTSSMIRKLPPEIPDTALRGYDTVSFLDKDSEKN